MAVQMTAPRAMRPVTPRTPLVLEAICCTCFGGDDPVVADQAGDVAVDQLDHRVDGVVVAPEPEAGDRERDVDRGEDREQRLIADARSEQEAVVDQEVAPHADREPGHRRLGELRGASGSARRSARGTTPASPPSARGATPPRARPAQPRCARPARCVSRALLAHCHRLAIDGCREHRRRRRRRAAQCRRPPGRGIAARRTAREPEARPAAGTRCRDRGRRPAGRAARRPARHRRS